MSERARPASSALAGESANLEQLIGQVTVTAQ
jgi:hypothetical protein